MKAYFQEMKPKFKLTFVDEPKPLGTAGGLSLLKGKLKKPFIVTNCDTIINVNLDERSYPIYIGGSILSDKELLKRHITSNQILIVTNEKVAPLYLEIIEKNFVKFDCEIFILPDGESYKTLDSLNQIITKLMKKYINI